MDILTLYTSMLNAGHMSGDEAGVIHRQIKGIEDAKTPVLVKLTNGERAAMVMPIKSQTDQADWSHRVVFHPLRENTQRGESLVMERFRINMVDRINAAVLVLMTRMLKLASDPAEQSNLTPDQLSYLSQLPDADVKALKNFGDLTLKCLVDTKPLRMFIKHSGIKDGIVYRRLCSVHSPMLEALETAVDRKVKGVALRVTDLPLFKTLFKLVFPQSTGSEFGYYTQGSNSVRAPSIDSFMKSLRLIAENINDLALMFDMPDHPIADSLMFDMAWTDVFEDIDAYSPKILLIPAMPGNEGRVLNERAETAKETIPPWEPASAPPAGMVADADGSYKPVGTVVTPASAPVPRQAPSYSGGYAARPAPVAQPASASSDDAFQKSAFYQLREREKQQQYDGGRSNYRQTDPSVANGYPAQNSYGGRDRGYDDRYGSSRDNRGGYGSGRRY